MSQGSVKITLVYHSGYGHTAAIAEHVAKGARDAGAEVTVLKAEEADPTGAEFSEAHAIIFGSPTYMGNVSGPFKVFADKTSKPWFTLAWKDKIAGGFTHSGSWSGDKGVTLHTLQTLAAQHAMIWIGNDLMPGHNTVAGSIEDLNRIGSFGGLMTQSPVDAGAEAIPPSDLKTAEHYGARIAQATARWNGVTLDVASATAGEALGIS
ncbi:flavodoxin family protein [bacterium]|nr:MAG: flavodoxin family protein [bacterium]